VVARFGIDHRVQGIGTITRKQRKRTVPPAGPPLPTGRRQVLSAREREILGLLAEGLSGAEIAEKLVLSPETVRTHVRNAMTKLGASTRSQAVALALRDEQIGEGPPPAGKTAPAVPARSDARDYSRALAAMLDGLVSLYDLDGGALYLADEDGLSLHRAATAGLAPDLPREVALGDPALGQVALERRTQVVGDAAPASARRALLAAPIIGAGRLLGVIALSARVSRPVGRRELLLLHAFSTRIGEILVAGQDVAPQLEGAMERFRGSWSGPVRTY
jgi:DNA-binding CsgD family transcriptional regulator